MGNLSNLTARGKKSEFQNPANCVSLNKLFLSQIDHCIQVKETELLTN